MFAFFFPFSLAFFPYLFVCLFVVGLVWFACLFVFVLFCLVLLKLQKGKTSLGLLVMDL